MNGIPVFYMKEILPTTENARIVIVFYINSLSGIPLPEALFQNSEYFFVHGLNKNIRVADLSQNRETNLPR